MLLTQTWKKNICCKENILNVGGSMYVYVATPPIYSPAKSSSFHGPPPPAQLLITWSNEKETLFIQPRG